MTLSLIKRTNYIISQEKKIKTLTRNFRRIFHSPPLISKNVNMNEAINISKNDIKKATQSITRVGLRTHTEI